jgi:large subunit ribosomal protein L20
MPRAKNNVAAHRRHKKVLQRAKGNFSGRSRLYRSALETVHRGMRYAYRDRRARKREFRALWITRISAAAQLCGTNYSKLINGLKQAGVTLDRKALADIAARDMATFTNLANIAAGK